MPKFALEEIDDAPTPAPTVAAVPAVDAQDILRQVGMREAKIAEREGKVQHREQTAHATLKLALGALSQRAIAGWSAVFSLLGLASVWSLYRQILDAPTTTQLVGIGSYSIFLLVLEFLRRRKA